MADTKTIRIPMTVYNRAVQVSESKGMTIKEAIRHMCQEGGYDV